ncbi:MAG: glycosyltransferase [Pyrinomonadaceae bacterium]
MSERAISKSPLVSVVMPAYNAARHIAESIESVREQTFEDWELIVVDDGSTDDTRIIVETYAAREARLRCFQRPNGGPAAARNTGLREARGTLVAFLDADDLWLSGKLEAQLALLEEKDVDLVYTDGDIFSDEATQSPDERFHIVAGETRGVEMFRTLFASNHIGTLSVLVKREALDAVGLFDENLVGGICEDYDLWLRLARNGASFYGIAEKLVKYRRHAASTTHTPSKLFAAMLAVLKKHGRDPALDEKVVKTRIRNLYRALAEALVREGKVAQAGRCLEEFAAWDGTVVTRAQRFVLKVWPRSFNFISREFLFRIEWHLNSGPGR